MWIGPQATSPAVCGPQPAGGPWDVLCEPDQTPRHWELQHSGLWIHLDHRGMDWGESTRRLRSINLTRSRHSFGDLHCGKWTLFLKRTIDVNHHLWTQWCGNDRNHPCFLWGIAFMPLIYSLLQCSASCGQGYRQRLISCSEVHVENDNYEYGHQSLSNCPGTPPESYMPCNLDPCPVPQEWRVGIWGPVSQSVFVVQSFYQSFIKMGHVLLFHKTNRWSVFE